MSLWVAEGGDQMALLNLREARRTVAPGLWGRQAPRVMARPSSLDFSTRPWWVLGFLGP